MNKSLKFKISIVIPVYNEAHNINACLDAIARQNSAFHEVIVVDNNSDDQTVELARQYTFVKIVKEPRQGVGYARDRGFAAATGDILARIDADTIVSDTWLHSIAEIFNAGSYQAVTGAVTYYGFRFNRLASNTDLAVRLTGKMLFSKMPFLLGSNMAITKNSWLETNANLCHSNRIHEDIDLAIHLQKLGYSCGFSSKMQVAISSRRYHSKAKDLASYAMALPRTYLLHGSGYYLPNVLLVFTCLALYLPIRKLMKIFSPIESAMSEPRVDPTTNIV